MVDDSPQPRLSEALAGHVTSWAQIADRLTDVVADWSAADTIPAPEAAGLLLTLRDRLTHDIASVAAWTDAVAAEEDTIAAAVRQLDDAIASAITHGDQLHTIADALRAGAGRNPALEQSERDQVAEVLTATADLVVGQVARFGPVADRLTRPIP